MKKSPWTTGQRTDRIRAGADRVPPWTTARRADAILGSVGRVPPWTTALVTGASSGIGEALARQLAARGVFVILTARRLPLIKKIASEIQRGGGRAVGVKMDVFRSEATAKQLIALDRKFGGIDLVIANAGVGVMRQQGVPSYAWRAVSDVLQINYCGALATITALLPAMAERRRGHVVAISSLAALTALPDAAGYCSPKAGLSRFMECLALDLAATGVAVTTVHVGFVRTAMVANSAFPLPFLMSAERAASHILTGLAKRRREINFPLPMVLLVKLIAALPFFVKKLIARRFSPAN